LKGSLIDEAVLVTGDTFVGSLIDEAVLVTGDTFVGSLIDEAVLVTGDTFVGKRRACRTEKPTSFSTIQ